MIEKCNVAPLAGAWIEILTLQKLGLGYDGRTPRGCVD